MAVFNPDVGGVPSPNMPDQTNASQGYTPNKSLGIFFEGTGDILSSAVKAVDTGIKMGIERDVRTGFENTIKPIMETVPDELKKSGSAMEALQTAYEQGKISDVYYTGQLVTLNKNLRSKYPGYEDYVDEMVQGITGIRPANSYRNALLQQFEDEKSAREKEATSWDTWVKQNEAYIYQVAPDYFTNTDKYDQAELRTAVVKKKADATYIEDESARLSLLASQDKLTKEQATESSTIILNDIVSSSLSANSNATFGINPSNFLKQIQEMSTSGPSPEEYNSLVTGFAQTKATIRMALEKRANQVDEYGNSIYKLVGATETKNIIDQAMAQYDQIEELLTNKEFGLAGYYTRLNTMGNDRELNRVLNASPELRTANALAQIDRSLSTLYITESGKQDGIFKDIAPEVTARIVTGEDNLDSVVDRAVSSNGSEQDKAGVINATLNNLLETIKSGNATPEQIVAAGESLFNQEKLWTYINPDESLRFYTKLFNPEVTNALISNGDKELLNTYYQQARERIFSIPELTKAAAALNDTQQDWKSFFEVQFNPSSGRLELLVKKGGVPMFGGDIAGKSYQEGILGGIKYSFDKKKAEEAINALNFAFDNLGNTAVALGADEKMKPAIYSEVLRQLNVDLEQGESEGFFKWLLDGAAQFFGTDESEGNALNQMIQDNVSLPTMGETVNEVVGDTASFDGYFEAIRAAESGGNDSAKNPNSTATGRYQFLTSTWNDLAKRYPQLGLTDRNNPEQQEAAIRVFTRENAGRLADAGIPLSNGNLYAAHFLGSEDAIDVLNADDSTLVSEYVSPRVIKANPFLSGMTVADFKRWASTKAS